MVVVEVPKAVAVERAMPVAKGEKVVRGVKETKTNRLPTLLIRVHVANS
jgi:hypothetical protein